MYLLQCLYAFLVGSSCYELLRARFGYVCVSKVVSSVVARRLMMSCYLSLCGRVWVWVCVVCGVWCVVHWCPCVGL